ncbi:MAG TPA: antitermination protein NusG, partial [Thermoanaerobaculia bacterium]|nr:antitermination protein NusG [Thermoanaerobaculia bacterium]
QQGRTRTSHLPLFPGYVFLRGGREGREAAWRSNIVAALLDVEDQQRLSDELRQIRELQLAGASLEPYEALVAGDAVRVTEGAFAGYSGVVVREKGRDRLLVMVSLLRKAVAVEFERELLAALHGA